MAELLKGSPVASSLIQRAKIIADELNAKGKMPKLAILRVGDKRDQISYEKNAEKRCTEAGIRILSVTFPEDISEKIFLTAIDRLNADPEVNGILMLRPLPKHIQEEAARNRIAAEKDIDGCGDSSLAGVFCSNYSGFAPCTARAVIELLDYYGVSCSGKRAAVIGRSLVVGRPLAMMLMHRDATVTICHTKTANMQNITRDADIVVVCAGKTQTIGPDYFSAGQIVVDVGIGWSEEKKCLCGDVRTEEAEHVVAAITPVPGGIGSVTTAVLALQTAEAAEQQDEQ